MLDPRLVQHPKTLDAYGIDPVDPMADFPVSFDVSLATYGSFWRFLGTPNRSYNYMELFFLLDKIPYDYKVFSGNAPDVLGAFIPFNFQCYLMWYCSFGDTFVDYTLNGTEPILTTEKENQYIKSFCAKGFRVRSSVPGDNVFYQLVVFR